MGQTALDEKLRDSMVSLIADLKNSTRSDLKLPETTPYSLDDILDEDWLPDIDE
jgi:hypothetical protein